MDLTHLQLAEIPDDGLHLEGSLPGTIFGIDPADALPVSPLAYTLDLLLSGDAVVVTGRIAATFERECVRCLDKFHQTINLDPYSADIDCAGVAAIDLTERLREDILLSLPAYPHCSANGDSRKCPAEDRFTAAPYPDDANPESGTSTGVWDILANWNQPPSND